MDAEPRPPRDPDSLTPTEVRGGRLMPWMRTLLIVGMVVAALAVAAAWLAAGGPPR